MSGFDSATVAQRLAGDEDRELIVAEIENAYRIGVSGVPCFIIDRRLAVTGAHPAEVLVQAIEQAARRARGAGEPRKARRFPATGRPGRSPS